MGADLGFFAEDRERDFPELNKCPDCETFFADANCPLCGKECPEEFRAGNRKAVKQKKHRRPSGNGRVQFVPWYHSTLFIVAMMIFFPIVGLILMWTGHWKQHWKIVGTVILVFFYLFGGILGGIIINLIYGFNDFEPPVNTSITEEEYRALCEEMDVETLYRQADELSGEYVKLTVEIVEVSASADIYEPIVYVCKAEKEGKNYTYIVCDYRPEKIPAFVAGDTVTFFGEVVAFDSLYVEKGTVSGPWINILYADLIS